MAAKSFSVESSAGKHAGQRIFRVSGALNLETEQQFLERIRAEPASSVILELSGVPGTDSRGIAALVQIHNAFEKEKRRLALVAISARVQHIMDITRVRPLFAEFETLEAAEEALALEADPAKKVTE